MTLDMKRWLERGKAQKPGVSIAGKGGFAPLAEANYDPFFAMYTPETQRREQKRFAMENQRVGVKAMSLDALVKSAGESSIKLTGTLIAPGINQDQALLYYENCPPLQSTIAAFINGTLGDGIRIHTPDGEPPKGAGMEAVMALLGADTTAKSQTTRETLSLLQLEAVLVDRETTGDGYLEIIEADGVPIAINHIPAVYIRVEVRTGERYPVYLYAQGTQRLYFSDVSDPERRNQSDGKPTADDDNAAHRLIHLTAGSLRGNFTGVPKWWGERDKAETYRACDLITINHMRNAPGLAGILFLTGGSKLEPQAKKNIDDYFRSRAMGVYNSGMVLTLELPGGATEEGYGSTPKPMIRYKPFDPPIPSEVYFELQTMIRDSFRACFRFSRLAIGEETGVNRASAVTLRRNDEENVFRTERRKLAALLNDTLVRLTYEAAGKRKKERYTGQIFISFEGASLTTQADQINSAKTLTETGAFTINEVRRAVGYEVVDAEDGGDEWGDLPLWLAQMLSGNPADLTIDDLAKMVEAKRRGELTTNG